MIGINTNTTPYCVDNTHYFVQWDKYSKAEFSDRKVCECGKYTYGELRIKHGDSERFRTC